MWYVVRTLFLGFFKKWFESISLKIKIQFAVVGLSILVNLLLLKSGAAKTYESPSSYTKKNTQFFCPLRCTNSTCSTHIIDNNIITCSFIVISIAE